MEDVEEDSAKARALEKMKERAMSWYSDAKAREEDAPGKRDISEKENAEQELRLVRDIKKAVVDSGIERKDIALMTLRNFEKQLEKGESPQNLPDVVKSLGKRPELSGAVREITKHYVVGSSSYYYLWGLSDG